MKGRQYNSRILKILGGSGVEIDPETLSIYQERCDDEGDIEITLIAGVESIEDKHTHTEGKFDQIIRVRAVRISAVKKV